MRHNFGCFLLTAFFLCLHAGLNLASAETPRLANRNPYITSSGTSSGAPAKAGVDTFVLYGGQGTLEGKFEAANGTPDFGGWTGLDRTEDENYWHVSTYNAETLGNHGAGNLAMWCGVEAGTPGYTTAPGYGNGWYELLRFESDPLVDPTVGQTVELDFLFHADLEPAEDVFVVQYERNGSFERVYFLSSFTHDPSGNFLAPGTRYSEQSPDPITFSGNDYGGTGGDQIVIRLYVATDGAWSDEDGLWPTDGAIQIDDMLVRYDDGTGNQVEVLEDFEGPGPYAFEPLRDPFAGDFAKLFYSVTDIDPCTRRLDSPLVTFVDDDTPPSNSPGVDGTVSTGGATSGLWSYGVPGGWVVNGEGGLSGGAVGLWNMVVSPPIALDLPGTEDDGTDVRFLTLEYDVWPHLPVENGIYYFWAVRYTTSFGESWTNWSDTWQALFLHGDARWRRDRFDFQISPDFEDTFLQIALGVRDYSQELGLPTLPPTPAPWFDNVKLIKSRVTGPGILLDENLMAHDAFPASGSLDASTPAARAQLATRFDASLDVDEGPAIERGDSVVVRVYSNIANVTVPSLRMHWALKRNPVFDDVRQLPSLGIYVNNDTSQPGIWTGEVLRQFPRDQWGNPIANTWYFDLPDDDFFFPGDEIHYYFRAEDSDGRVSTLPADLEGFLWDGAIEFDARFTVRALPSLNSTAGEQPPTLLVAASGYDAERDALLAGNIGLVGYPGEGFDIFTVRRTGEALNNGLGASGTHGASVAQLGGYDTIVIAGGSELAPLSDADLAQLRGWQDTPGNRNLLHLGDDLASSLENTAPGQAYLDEVMGVVVQTADATPLLPNRAPVVVPTEPHFASEWAAYGACPDFRRFDGITPNAQATTTHVFQDEWGNPVAGLAAGVVRDDLNFGNRKVSISFPVGMQSVYPRVDAEGWSGLRTAVLFFMDMYDYFGVHNGGHTAVPDHPRELQLSASPNPFNPVTTVRLHLPQAGPTEVRVHDLRGALVTVLLNETRPAGPLELRWDGTDSQGAAVASGIYLVSVKSPAGTLSVKVALLK